MPKTDLRWHDQEPSAEGERLRRERHMLAAAEDDLNAGRVIEGDEAEAWLRAWAGGGDAATPKRQGGDRG
ncbi:hypothetical protein [Methylobacterium oryzihabitans]|uniref:CopG family transcriptional regulator n=1 Tax=Methylobacterium oryzihabitans TaxID=2499852 RepID=A0A3S2VBR1_9HYPH|nr:hypothetical protein [Methylobacterium oryzihabitans]RVU20693.1 hypothetical protein EOE48_04925 [Methylobacterium oryzihabitans]